MDLYNLRGQQRTSTVDFLALFEVTDQTTPAEIQHRYRLMMMYMYHPDRYVALPEPDRTLMLQIAHKQACVLNKGYAALRTPEGLQAYLTQRANHDRSLTLHQAPRRVWRSLHLAGNVVRQRPLCALGSIVGVLLVLLWLSPWLIADSGFVLPVVSVLLIMTIAANVAFYSAVWQRITPV